jgi:hypothetical protein
MATRNRIIYQSEALFVDLATRTSDDGHSETAQQLYRVQDISHDMDINRTDIFEFGQLAPLTRQIIEAPTVSLDFSYLLADGENEKRIGLVTDGISNAISGILEDSDKREKNYYVTTVSEYNDVNVSGRAGVNAPYNASRTTVVGFGNAAITNYTVNVAVGDLPTASVTCEAYNLKFDRPKQGLTDGVWLSGTAPTINKETSREYEDKYLIPTGSSGNLEVFSLRPGDVTMTFAAASRSADELQIGGAILPTGDPDSASVVDGKTPIHIQNFSIEVPLARTPLNRIGSVFPYERAIDFPLDMTVNISALLADMTTGSLVDLMCNDQDQRNITINCSIPCASNDDASSRNMQFVIKNAYLQSQNMSATIGDNKTVDLSFTSQFGGVTDQDNGLFISGYNQ